MISVDCKVIGGEAVAKRLADANSGIRDAIRSELAEVGTEIVARAQSLAPKRTGGLANRIVWYFGREMKRGPKGAKRMTPVDVKWKDGHIEFTARPKGRVAHLMERGVSASFYQRPGKRGGFRRGHREVGPFGGEAMQGPEYRYPRTLQIAPRPFFMPAVESVGGASGVNSRLQAVLDRVAAERAA